MPEPLPYMKAHLKYRGWSLRGIFSKTRTMEDMTKKKPSKGDKNGF
jgi:hypothetical protein